MSRLSRQADSALYGEGVLVETADRRLPRVRSNDLAEPCAVIEEDVRRGRIPGAVALVARGGEVRLAEAFGHADLAANRPMSLDTIFRIYSMTKPMATAALLRLVEVLTERPFDEGIRAEILDPLEMDDTRFAVDVRDRSRLAKLYQLDDDRRLIPQEERLSHRYLESPRLLSGGGGLVSTARDCFRFAEMIANGGELDGVRVLRPESVDEMLRDQLTEIPRGRSTRGYSFGLGFAIATDPTLTETALGEAYWSGLAGTQFWIDRRRSLVGVYLVQILPHYGLSFARDFKRSVYRALDLNRAS